MLSCRRFALLHKDQRALQELLPTLGPLLSKLPPPVDTTLLRVPVQASMAAMHAARRHVCQHSWRGVLRLASACANVPLP